MEDKNITNLEVIDTSSLIDMFPTYNTILMSDMSAMNEEINTRPPNNILYSGVILDDQSHHNLLSYVKEFVDIPKNWKRLAHHMTITFKEELPSELKDDLGEIITLTVKKIGISDDAIAVEVEGYPTNKSIPHITVAIPPDGKPVNSNYIKNWEEVNTPLILNGEVREIGY